MKGQVTIPAKLRKELNLMPGDAVHFSEHDGKLVLRRVENRIEAAFGLIRAERGLSLVGMDDALKATRSRGARR